MSGNSTTSTRDRGSHNRTNPDRGRRDVQVDEKSCHSNTCGHRSDFKGATGGGFVFSYPRGGSREVP